MVYKYIFGEPFETDAVVKLPNDAKVFDCSKSGANVAKFPCGKIEAVGSFKFLMHLKDSDVVFGLGQALGGINKRGRLYKSWCNDDPIHSEEKTSLYGAHNFILIYSPDEKNCFGLFFDYPGLVTFDVGFSKYDELTVTAENADLVVYYIKSENSGENGLKATVREFRKMIGQSYEEPFWSFGFMQSRWGYASEKDLMNVLENHKKNKIPLDAIFLDIDYMNGFRDFTVNKENFPDFKKTILQLKEKNIHVVPIIDAGIKAEEGFDVDDEGRENSFYCKKNDGTLFEAAVWPGISHFPDFLNPDARKWFGKQYKVLLEAGISGFWNDMNEPALFYSQDGIKKASDDLIAFANDAKSPDRESGDIISWKMKSTVLGVQNNMEDYKSFYHSVPLEKCGNFSDSVKDGFGKVRHDKIHNLYGFNMTRAASEFFAEYQKSKGKASGDNIFLLSRASYIGSHRYGGIWTGDNASWWSHILLCLKMMPSLNMCGFIYTGCDLGGFGCDTNRELLLRFLALGVFTPLMRNHSASGTREQECYKFEKPEDFRAIIDLRYRLLPYLYNEYLKACREGEMYFKPLAFDFPDDEIALSIEDELLLGDDVMIAPVYTPNATGRLVYLPCDMYCVSCKSGKGADVGNPETVLLKKGEHFVHCLANEVVFFIKKGHAIPVIDAAENTSEIDYDSIKWWGDAGAAGKYKMTEKI